MTGTRWTTSSKAVYNIGYHLIWCPQYRRPVLVGEVEWRLREWLAEKAASIEVDIVEMEIMPDHVHLFVRSPPTLAPHHVVQQLKGYSSRRLREQYSSLRSRLPTLWTTAPIVKASATSQKTRFAAIAKTRRESERVEVRRTLKYRLYRNRRNKKLHEQIEVAGQIWNHLTALQRCYYQMTGRYVNKYRMMKHIARLRRGAHAHWQVLGSQAVQDVAQRHDAAYQRFFKWLQTREGRRVSPPRFRKPEHYKSFTLKQAGWAYLGDNRLRVGKQVYKFALSRPVEGDIKTVTIKRDRLGRLYVCFSVVQDVQPSLASTNEIGGVDFGLKTFLTDHQGQTYNVPEVLRES